MGSEHEINEKKFFSEAHFVHYNLKYKNFDAAVEQHDGLAVLGYFIDIS